MPNEVEPALTPEEWKQREFRSAGQNRQIVALDLPLHLLRFHDERTVDRGKHTTFVWPREFIAVMALANDALPDGDPRKITRADVGMLQRLARQTARVEVEITAPDGSVQRYEGLTRLAAKLAALLPSEE